ncbi:Fimbrial assembly family protein [Desulfobulbus propionicus DSM 2032]|jgi:type IV pilus assembly protein PilN|uniref:Fimbrial assembly family protein n=1 Tax=Desulfobulbus propionicus (strain ATCC 33891 / DSM 2032 / VKM B-1956 / 1pr3) TaxID=577650 RepID=A0A7U3YPU3_DESPD|nr:PilN domain-containing protein [Desulfobulbus propionicus]ADW19348.1 Fimbrial assembly family protein [Desulfobulbus propionicus DSM 2032]
MIHINLLPVREIIKRNKAKQQINLSIIFFGALVIVLIAFGYYQSNIVKKMRDTNAALQSEKKQYDKILAEIKKIDEEKKVLATRIEVIKQLKQSSSLTVHVLDEIANLIPFRRMWLKGITQDSAQLSLTGMALDDQTIAKFMDDLENSKYIKNVTLVSSSMEKFADRDLKAFSTSCTVGFENNDTAQRISN